MHVPLATPFGRQVRTQRFALETVLSAVVHLVALSIIIWLGHRAIVAERAAGEGPGAGGGGGGGWGRAIAVFSTPAVEVAATPPEVEQIETAALEIPTVVEPLPEPTPDSVPPAAPAAAPAEQPAASGEGAGAGPGTGAGAGPGSGGGSGGGTGGGTGSGVGPDSGGAGGRVFPPQPQGIILPPSPSPRSLRGRRVTVVFTVGERGEVIDVEVEPPIEDRGYRNQFMERMRRYTFTPGYTPGGRPVRAEYPIAITL